MTTPIMTYKTYHTSTRPLKRLYVFTLLPLPPYLESSPEKALTLPEIIFQEARLFLLNRTVFIGILPFFPTPKSLIPRDGLLQLRI